jgi:hypothetical protein
MSGNDYKLVDRWTLFFFFFFFLGDYNKLAGHKQNTHEHQNDRLTTNC